MNRIDELVFTETDMDRVDAVLYQAMFDETIRLRKCITRGERKEIRDFLMGAYQLFSERNLENEHQSISPESKHLQIQ